MRAHVLFCCCLLAGGATVAAADPVAPVDHSHALELHATAGVELTGGEGVLGVGFRGRFAVGRSFGDGAVRPNVTIGALVGSGQLVVDDPRALGAGLALGYQSYGPELQLGLRFVAGDGGHVDSRVFASVSTLRVELDPRLMLDAVPGVSRAGDVGLRASLGGNWIERVTQANTGGLIFLPQQAEVVWERDAGSTRYGVLLSWGI